MFDKIIKYGIYVLAFLMPVFFLPATVMPVIINKQMLLSIFAFSLLVLWMMNIMISGKIKLDWSRTSQGILLFIAAVGLSTILSGSKMQSLWGMNFEPDSFYCFILYSIIFFLISNLIEKKEVFNVLLSFLLSSASLALIFLTQASGLSIFSWSFTNSLSFNPIGSIQSLGIFLGGAFVILITLIHNNLFLKKIVKYLSYALAVFLFLILFMMNYRIIWLGIAISTAIISWKTFKNLQGSFNKDFKKLILPLFLFVFAFSLLATSLPSNIVSLPSEVSLTNAATFNIALKTLGEGLKSFFVGSGPATFAYQYNLYKGAAINSTDFWSTQFDQGGSTFLTLLTTLGIAGTLFLFGTTINFFIKSLKRIKEEKFNDGLELSVLIGGIYFLINWFIYPFNSSLLFIGFLMLGLWIAMTGKHKEFSFSQSSQKAFIVMIIGTFVLVASIIGLYSFGQKYVAALDYAQGIAIINSLNDSDENSMSKLNQGIIKINKATELDTKDLYFRNLSQAFLIQTNYILNDESITNDQKKQLFQQAVSNAELSANAAVKVNPKSSQNLV